MYLPQDRLIITCVRKKHLIIFCAFSLGGKSISSWSDLDLLPSVLCAPAAASALVPPGDVIQSGASLPTALPLLPWLVIERRSERLLLLLLLMLLLQQQLLLLLLLLLPFLLLLLLQLLLMLLQLQKLTTVFADDDLVDAAVDDVAIGVVARWYF